MALIGYARVSTDRQDTARQVDALTNAGVPDSYVYTEKLSGKTPIDGRPQLQAALSFMREGDVLCIPELDRLGRNMLDGLTTLTALFDRGITVQILDGIARGEHSERSLIIDLGFALAEDERRKISQRTRAGLRVAREQGRVGGRPPVMTEHMTTQALALRDAGLGVRDIAMRLFIESGARRGQHPSFAAVAKALREHDTASTR